MFSEGGFSDKKCTKIVFVFSRGSAPDPVEGTIRLNAPPDLVVRWGREIPPVHFLAPQRIRCLDVRFDFCRAMLCIRGICYGPVSVCLSVCPSQVGVLLKRLNIGSHKQHRTIAQGL